MKPRFRIVLSLLIALWSVSLTAQETAAPRAYRVQIIVAPGSDAGAVAKGVAATYAARLESPVDPDDNTVVMTIADSVRELLERDPRVARLQDESGEKTAIVPPAAVRDPAVRPSTIGKPRLAANSTATPWTTGTYQYDASGNITGIGSDRFAYDVYSRLTSGTAAGGTSLEVEQQYSYDRYGNLTSIQTGSTTIPLTVATSTNRLTAHNGSAVSYDAAGQVLQAGSSTYTYDGGGMMTSSGNSGTPSRLYLYTAADERIASVMVSGSTEISSSWSFRDASGRVLRRFDKQKQSSVWTWIWREDYIYNGTQLLASENDAAPKTRHYFADHLGSPRLITDSGGMTIGFHTYLPYGAELTAAGYGLSDAQRFTGQERDLSNLDYMHARYYNWGWGRFLSVDPARTSTNPKLSQTWNRYSYAYDNPVRLVDPDGRNPVETQLRASMIMYLMKDKLDPKIHFTLAGGLAGKVLKGGGVKGFNYVGVDFTDNMNRGTDDALDVTFQYEGLGVEAVIKFDGIVPSIKEAFLLAGPFAKSLKSDVEDKFSMALAFIGGVSIEQKLDNVLPDLFEYLAMPTDELMAAFLEEYMKEEGYDGYRIIDGQLYFYRYHKDKAK